MKVPTFYFTTIINYCKNSWTVSRHSLWQFSLSGCHVCRARVCDFLLAAWLITTECCFQVSNKFGTSWKFIEVSLAKTAQDFCFPKGRLHLFVFALRSLIRPFLYTAPIRHCIFIVLLVCCKILCVNYCYYSCRVFVMNLSCTLRTFDVRYVT